MNQYIEEVKKLWANYVDGFNTRDTANWQYYAPVMAILPISIAALFWKPGWGATLLHISLILYLIGFITTPISAWWDVRTKKRSVLEVKTMLLLFLIGWPIGTFVLLAFVWALSYPIQAIFGSEGLFTMVLGDVGSIIGPLILLGSIPVIWRLLGASRSTGFKKGTGQALNEIAKQMKKSDVHQSPTSRTEEHRTFMDDICNNDSGYKTTISSRWGDIEGFGNSAEESQRTASEELEHREKHWPKT